MIPQDPGILFSYINTKLRDENISLSELCEDLEADIISVTGRLAAAGFYYDEKANRFYERTRIKQLTEHISYLPSSTRPLSSDIGIIGTDKGMWIFDVGNNDEAVNIINGIKGEKNIVLSHFHEDHTGNINRISYNKMYCGNYTEKKLCKGIVVDAPVTFDEAIKITVFPIPSTHSKGAVGLEVNEEYAFLGDAVYSAMVQGQPVFNQNLLKETIITLRQLKAEYFLLSHDREFIQPRDKVIEKLEEHYGKRRSGEAYIILN